MSDVILTSDDAGFLAARLRRLFKHCGYPIPSFAESDESLIRIAGAAIGAILTKERLAAELEAEGFRRHLGQRLVTPTSTTKTLSLLNVAEGVAEKPEKSR